MATVNITSATLRKSDQFDIQALTNGGKTIAAINISVDSDGLVTITYAKGNGCEVKIVEATNE